MALLNRSDLKLQYSWSAVAPDDPRITGKPDSTLLNRQEGYEVLNFINSFAAEHGFKNKETGWKVERMLQKHPGAIRSHKNVKAWLVENWKNFN